MRLRLRTRVALSFAALSLLVAGTVSVTTYAFARWYLLDQRETTALTRAALDSRAVGAYPATGSTPSAALATAERYALEGNNPLALRSAEAAMAGIDKGSGDWLREKDIAMAARGELDRDKKGKKRK